MNTRRTAKWATVDELRAARALIEHFDEYLKWSPMSQGIIKSSGEYSKRMQDVGDRFNLTGAIAHATGFDVPISVRRALDKALHYNPERDIPDYLAMNYQEKHDAGDELHHRLALGVLDMMIRRLEHDS